MSVELDDLWAMVQLFVSHVWSLKNDPEANFLHFRAHLMSVQDRNFYGQDCMEIAGMGMPHHWCITYVIISCWWRSEWYPISQVKISTPILCSCVLKGHYPIEGLLCLCPSQKLTKPLVNISSVSCGVPLQAKILFESGKHHYWICVYLHYEVLAGESYDSFVLHFLLGFIHISM